MGAQESLGGLINSAFLLLGIIIFSSSIGNIISRAEVLSTTVSASSEGFLLASALSLSDAYDKAMFVVKLPNRNRIIYIRNETEFVYFTKEGAFYINMVKFKDYPRVYATNDSYTSAAVVTKGTLEVVVK